MRRTRMNGEKKKTTLDVVKYFLSILYNAYNILYFISKWPWTLNVCWLHVQLEYFICFFFASIYASVRMHRQETNPLGHAQHNTKERKPTRNNSPCECKMYIIWIWIMPREISSIDFRPFFSTDYKPLI